MSTIKCYKKIYAEFICSNPEVNPGLKHLDVLQNFHFLYNGKQNFR